MRIFVAGASGLIGVRLVPLLVAAGHEVAGMTRSPDKAGRLRDLGAEPVIGDVFDAGAHGAGGGRSRDPVRPVLGPRNLLRDDAAAPAAHPP